MRRLLILVLLLFAGHTEAQKLTPAQQAALNALFVKQGDETVPGTWITVGTIPLNRLVSTVVSVEADPVWASEKPGYVTRSEVVGTYLTAESDPVWVTQRLGYYSKTELDARTVFSGAWVTNTWTFLDENSNVVTKTIVYWGLE